MSDKKSSVYTPKAIRLFFIIVIVASAVAEALIITTKAELLYAPLMWIPAIAALIALSAMNKERGTESSFKQKLVHLGFRKCSLRYVLMGIFLPLIYLLIPYLLFWLIYPESMTIREIGFVRIFASFLVSGLIGLFFSLLTALGEEIGWRGFMFPALSEKHGFKKAIIISSLIWCLWHFPLLIFGDYMQGAVLWFKLPAFLLCIFPVGVMVALLTAESKSVWPAALLHAAHNCYDQSLFGIVTKADNKMLFVSETGVFTIICAWLIVFFMLRRMKKLRTKAESEKGE